MWSDVETNIDFLGYDSLVKTITGLITDSGLSPITIGVHGDWGAGKSSVLKMIEGRLSEDTKTCCLTFNGWLFQGYDDTKSIIMETIIRELVSQQPTNEKLKSKAKELLANVNWLRLARVGGGVAMTALTGIPDLSGIATIVKSLKDLSGTTHKEILPEQISLCAESLQTVLDKPSKRAAPSISEEIHAFRVHFEELLQSANIDNLVVLVDDLDRCLPVTAIDTLEAIRLFLFVPGTAFVLAMDEAMIAYAVKSHFPDLPASVGPADYTKNYLEKLVQVPFRIPPMSKTETKTFLTLLLAENALHDDSAKFHKILETAKKELSKPWEGRKLDDKAIKDALGELPEEIKDILLLVDRIYMPLAEGLKGNPRQIKRFLNTFKVRQRVAVAQGISELIDAHILAKLMLLERFEEPLYRDLTIQAGQSEDGTVSELSAFEDFAKKGTAELKAIGEKETADRYPSEWLKNEWFLRWARIEPSLKNRDLRPYIYISREKIAGFTRDSGLGAELDEIARKLASGKAVILSGAKKLIKSLTNDDARRVFDYLADKARQSSTWKTKPNEVDGLYELAKVKIELQDSLVDLFESIPVKELGRWAAAGMGPILSEESARSKFETLQERWKTQAENPLLKSAVEKLSKI